MIPALASQSKRATAASPMERTTKVADKSTALVTGQFPPGRVGEPADLTGLVSYLLSLRAAWMAGASIPVDGVALLR